MPKLDEQTLHKVRRMAAAGAPSPVIAARLAVPVEQVEFVCGRVPSGERGDYGGLVPQITEVDKRRDDPSIPFSYLPQFCRLPNVDADELVDRWQHRWEESHRTTD